jgi:hypothetical protein
MSHALHDLQEEQNANRPINARSAPLPNEVRHRGAADERQRGPRGARGACYTLCTTFKKSKTPTSRQQKRGRKIHVCGHRLTETIHMNFSASFLRQTDGGSRPRHQLDFKNATVTPSPFSAFRLVDRARKSGSKMSL